MKILLKMRREDRNMTQKQLVTESGVSQGTISKIEAGLLMPRVDTLQKLAKALRYPVQRLISEDE